MNTVKVFEITSLDTCYTGEFHEFTDQMERWLTTEWPGGKLVPVDGDSSSCVFTRFVEPVHTIMLEGEPVFIAVHPEIRHVLQQVYEAPIRAQVDEALRMHIVSREGAQAMSKMLGQQLTRIERFLGASLWQRLKWAWRCDFPGGAS